MTTVSYQQLAVSWSPENRDNRAFYIITASVIACIIVCALIISSVTVPVKERRVKQAVPDRVAKFITKTKKPEIKKPEPKVKPKPKPIPKPSPKVVRKKETEAEKKKPLTVKEKEARDTAANSGLLALGSQLADLMDTTDVSTQVGAKVSKASASSTKVAAVDTGLLTANASAGTGGANTSDYVAAVGTTQLSQRDIDLVKQSLLKSDEVEKVAGSNSQSNQPRGDNVRSEEEVQMVFDQNKSQLYSIYNRERRKKPGLKGRLVLEITISPDGSVSNVRIVSTELNDPALERRLVQRVKLFKFTSSSVEPVTVTFPIEFLPS